MELIPNMNSESAEILDSKSWNKEVNLDDNFSKDIKIKSESIVCIERKCGEIYFTNDIFQMNCNYCANKFDTIKVFVKHFIKNHSSLTKEQAILALEQILDDSEEQNIEMEEDQRGFDINLDMNVVHEENSIDCKSNEIDFLKEEEIKVEPDIYEKNSNDINTLNVNSSDSFDHLDENSETNGSDFEIFSEQENKDNQRSASSRRRRSNRTWNCSVCHTTFTRRDNMLRHKWIKHNEKPNPDYGEVRLDCKWCGQHFKRHSDRSRHENQQHAPDGTKLNRRRNYKKNPLERHICETCGNSYKHAFSLEEHIRVHTGERPYKCELCSATFAKKQNFMVHQQYHSNERRYKCQYCNKGFVQKSKLVIHEMVHTGTYNAQCTICGRQYRCGSMLNVHMKRHLDDKIHECEKCKKAFYTADLLKRHSAVHLAIKPFHCDICSVDFARKGSLQKHMKKRHKDGPIPSSLQQGNVRLRTVAAPPRQEKNPEQQ